ncbi:TetR/AcrR family transcriptional regulator [Geodermatophilus sp. SYSU D00691]
MDPSRGSDGLGRGRPEQRAAFLAGAVEHVLDRGVTTLSLRPLAASLGTSDRMLLYYFGSREQLLAAVLAEVSTQLQDHLSEILPERALSPAALLRAAEAALRSDRVDRHLRLYVEISGLAAHGQEPFRTVAAAVAEGWRTWLEERLDVADDDRAAAAAGVLATIDGLLLLRFLVAPDVADRAVAWLAAEIGR